MNQRTRDNSGLLPRTATFCSSLAWNIFLIIAEISGNGTSGSDYDRNYSRLHSPHSLDFNLPWRQDGVLDVMGGGLRCPTPSIARVRVEKIEGGLMVAGVQIAANCQVALPAFGFLFLLVGCVLTAASYRGPAVDEGPDHYAARIAFTGNSRALGPACIVVGMLMLTAGLVLCLLTQRARQKETRVGFHCPLHGDFFPPANQTAGYQTAPWSICWRGSVGSRGRGEEASHPHCPHSTLSSTRSSLSSAPVSPCPTPLPFLVTSGSLSMVPVGAGLSPDQTFGSIRSLSVSRDVASFPLSRSPSPTPPPTHRCSVAGSPEREIVKIVAPAPPNPKGPRKSVSIVLPDDDIDT